MKLPIAFTALSVLALSACSSYGGNDNNRMSSSSAGYSAPANCYDCGVVQRVESYTGEQRRTSGVGAVAGALIGGALGNQVGKGDGKKVATVAGAVAGGFAGNAIEKNNMDKTWHEVTVRMNDGRTVVLSQDDLNGVREGSRVIIRNGRAELN